MKKRLVLSVSAILVLLAAAYGLYKFGMQQGMNKSTSPQTEIDDTNAKKQSGVADKKVLYWHDPMVPGQKFDKPGKSPFMDMQLVPVYADNGADTNRVRIDPRVQQNLGVRTAEVTTGDLAQVVEAVGSVAFNERDVVLIQARSNGFVERLHVRAPLDRVRKGQPLIELYVPDWIAAQEEYLTVERMQGAGLTGLLEGARQRMRLVGMSEDQIRRVSASGRVQPRFTLSAPITGVVSELAVREGMTVMSGAPLFRINGLANIWVNADVPETLSAQLNPGTAVEARTSALPGTVLKGKVSAILPEVNAATRTIKARVELANPDGRLAPGMFVTVRFMTASGKDVLLVPSEAVIQTGKRNVVIIAQGEGKFTPVEVETGREANNQTEIRKGLEVGQKVVVSGQFLIDSEASLKGVITRLSEPPGLEGITPPVKTHSGAGKVEHVGKDEITLSHGPIPSLQWGPMTMGFKIPAAGLPKNIAVGDHVNFEIRTSSDGKFEIVRIFPVSDATTGAAK